MKRFLALLALVLGMVSCQTEPEGLDVIVGGAQDVTVTVAIPEAETRADADWNFSKEGAFKNVVGSDAYTIRYIFDVYYGTARAERQVKYSDEESVAFGVRLVPEREYSFVVWADVVAETDREENAWSNDDNAYYNTEHLHAITLKDTWNAMDETRDAFTGVHTETNYTGSSNITISLTRPFAKLRVVTTDFDELAKFGIEAKYATVAYTTPYVSEFNALVGKAVAAAENGPTKTHTYAIKSYADETGDEHTIFSDYIFTVDPGVVKFNMEVFEEDMTKRIKANSFNTDIQVRPNYITTLKGDVLTTGGNVTITVNPGFADDEIVENYVDTAEDLQNVIDNATDGQETVVVLGGDVDLSELFGAGILSTRAAEPAFGLEIPAGKKLVLDLNGKRVYQTKACSDHYSMILNNGDLTITGEGAIEFTNTAVGGSSDWGTYTIENRGEAVLTIDNATIRHNGCVNGETEHDTNIAIQNYEGKVVINDGTIASPQFRSLRDFTAGGEIIINGGTFVGQVWMQGLGNGSSSLTITGGSFSPVAGYDGSSIYITNNTNVVNVAITGGLFNTKVGCYDATKEGANGCIVGGSFTATAKENTAATLINDDYAWVEAEGLWTLDRKPNIVKIGEVGYTSLAKAVAAAQNGDTVVFDADVEQEDGVIITDKNITIDLNDKTFTVSNGASTNNRNFKVNGSSVVTIMNGTMVAAGEYSSGAYGTLRTEGTANVTLNDVKLYNYRGNGFNVKACAGTNVTITDAEVYSQYGGGVEAAGGIVELNDVKIDQKGMYTAPYNSMAVSVNGGGTVTVNSGTYSTECITAEEAYNQGTSHGPWCAGVMNSGGTLIIKGGTFSNDNFGDNALATYARGLLLADTGANIQIEGGVFNAVKAIIDMTNNLGDASRNPSATISGGDFSADPQVSGLYASHLIKVAEGYKVVENNGRWTVVVDPAAKIGEREYASLQEAFNVGGEITLLRNVAVAETVVLAEGKEVVLDLNGKTLSATDMNTIKNNGGNLTLKNGTVTRTGDAVGYSVNNASGEINVVDATVERGLYTSGSKMTATNANISHEQSSRHAIYAWNCEVTINSGTFHNDNAGNATLMAAGSSVVTINGGTFSIADGRSTLGWTSCMMDQNGTAQVIVKGGLFNGGFRINSADTTLTIEGGEFNTNNGSAFTDNSGTKVVKGGKFTDTGAQNWAKKYIADGYKMNTNGEVVAE